MRLLTKGGEAGVALNASLGNAGSVNSRIRKTKSTLGCSVERINKVIG